MTARFSSALVLVSSLAASFGCSAGAGPSSLAHGNDPNGNGPSVTPAGGASGGLDVNGSAATTGRDPADMRDVPVRKKTCDESGANCTCLRLALLGTLTSAAADSDTAAFVTWLNGKSNGTATVTNVPAKPTLDATFLAQYDILLVANVNSWGISAAEQAAVQKWVTDVGGGIINLTGFSSTPTESQTSSQLIAFSGIHYTGTAPTDYAAPASGELTPVYYKGGSVDLKKCMYWTGTALGSAHSSPHITTPIKFTPQTGTLDKLTLGLDYVGAFIGWPIAAPASATVLAKDPVTGGNMAVALEYNGKGRIFAFGDEWVIFSNEWAPVGSPSNMQKDAGNPCWVPATTTAPGFFHSVQTIYQTKQFWYDAINWVAPPNECNFIVTDPDVIVK